MNQTLTITSAQSKSAQPSDSPHEEGFLHLIAREGRTALRWCIVLCVIGIVAVMVSPLWFVAVIPAAIMLACYILLALANAVEKRSDAKAHAALDHREIASDGDIVDDHAEESQIRPDAVAVVKRESKWGIVILGLAILAALLLAFLVLEWRVFAIGSLVVFACLLLFAAPALLGAFNDDIEDETERLHHTHDGEPAAQEA